MQSIKIFSETILEVKLIVKPILPVNPCSELTLQLMIYLLKSSQNMVPTLLYSKSFSKIINTND